VSEKGNFVDRNQVGKLINQNITPDEKAWPRNIKLPPQSMRAFRSGFIDF